MISAPRSLQGLVVVDGVGKVPQQAGDDAFDLILLAQEGKWNGPRLKLHHRLTITIEEVELIVNECAKEVRPALGPGDGALLGEKQAVTRVGLVAKPIVIIGCGTFRLRAQDVVRILVEYHSLVAERLVRFKRQGSK